MLGLNEYIPASISYLAQVKHSVLYSLMSCEKDNVCLQRPKFNTKIITNDVMCKLFILQRSKGPATNQALIEEYKVAKAKLHMRLTDQNQVICHQKWKNMQVRLLQMLKQTMCIVGATQLDHRGHRPQRHR